MRLIVWQHYLINQFFILKLWKIGLNEWFSDSLVSLLDESAYLNESLEWMIQWLTCFVTGWISVFEQISWVNDSMTHLFPYWMNQCIWTNLLNEWFNDSLVSLLDESEYLNKSLEWMIQWLTCFVTGWISVFERISWVNDSMTHLFRYWMNPRIWTNLLREWFNDSLVSLLHESVYLNESLEWMIQWLTCFVTGWISVFERISWMNDSMTHLFRYWMNQRIWTNLLSEWFNDSLVSLLDESAYLNESLEWMIQWLTCFVTGWISVFERISWVNDSMTHLFRYCMNQCIWTNLLSEWFNDSLVSLLDESAYLNESLEWMIQGLTCFVTGWISVFERISWMNDSMTHLFRYWMNQRIWTNLLNEWFNDSLVSLLDESAYLNESLEWMIQWQIKLLTVTCRHLLAKQCNRHKRYLKRQLLSKGDLLYFDRCYRLQCLYPIYKLSSQYFCDNMNDCIILCGWKDRLWSCFLPKHDSCSLYNRHRRIVNI